MKRKNITLSFLINLALLIFCITMAFSGLMIQIGYHMGRHENIDATRLVLGLTYFNWSAIHKISGVAASISAVLHIILHGKWYKTVLRKKSLIIKNQQVLVLSIVFILAAGTGYLAWFITSSSGSYSSGKFYIEMHDKIALILLAYLILHAAERLKWFLTALASKVKEIPIKKRLL